MGFQTWRTPVPLFNFFHTRYSYDLDLCAEAWSAQTPDFCSLPNDDGLKRDIRGRRVWCNPPYDNIAPWVERAIAGRADIFTLLVPANTDQKWFGDLFNLSFIEFIRGRVSFVPPPEYKGKRFSARFPLMAVHTGTGIHPGFSICLPPRR